MVSGLPFCLVHIRRPADLPAGKGAPERTLERAVTCVRTAYDKRIKFYGDKG